MDRGFNRKIIISVFVLIVVILGIGLFYLLNSASLSQNTLLQNNNTNSSHYFSDVQTSPNSASYLILGASNIQVSQGAVVVTQVARVIRDSESKLKTNVSAGSQPNSPNELVPYMEGARVKEIMNYSGAKIIPATNVPAKKINGSWYGPDDKGNFVFLLDPGKVRPLLANKTGPDSVNVVETHGMSLLVPTAVNDHAFLVVACGDTPGKAEAEAYMASKGINCYAPCDRYTPTLLNNTGPGTILGTMPVRPLKDQKGALIGAQPIAISMKEKIIVQTTKKAYPSQYCDTPDRYFTSLEKVYGVKLDLVVVDASVGETSKVVDQARKTGSNVIAVRVENKADRMPVEAWLRENPNHRAVLFHTASYDEGYPLFFEFPNQVTGQDTKPVFIKAIPLDDIQKRFNQIRSLWGPTPQPPKPPATKT